MGNIFILKNIIMYKNFNLTESERERILGMHKEHGYKKAINEQSSGYVGDEQEVSTEESSTGGYPLSVRMAIMSHLSDLQERNRDSKDEINFIKVLIRKYMSKDIEVDTDKLDALYDQVSSGDFSGSALDETAMDDMNEGWRDIFGEPDVKDAARSAYKSQGHSMMGSDDEQREGEYYTVFNGEKFFSNQIEYADYQDMGELPRVENGMLIVPNPAWES